jgi:hypothetical protein
MRFLHLADVHLDTPFAGRTPHVRAALRRASRTAFGRAVDCALAERVDAVLIAGDLFDGVRLSFETERFLLDELLRLERAGIPVVYATGNHDPGREGGRAGQLVWPANVVVVPDGSPRRIAVRDADARVTGHVTAAGHAGPRELRDLAAGFPRPAEHRPEVALLHARVVGSRDEEAHEPYAPVELATLQRAGYHYWALGHVHVRQELSRAPAVHYPGNLQGRTHMESGAKGGLLVELDPDGRADVAFRPFAPVRWETLELAGLDGVATLDGLVGAVRRRWDDARTADPSPGTEWMVRVVLRGGAPLWSELADPDNIETLARELAEHLGALEVEVRADGLHAVVDASEHQGRADVLGVALRRLAGLGAGDTLPAGLVTELAGLQHAGSPPAEAYVRGLLDDARGELAARMLDPRSADSA